jgi:hypothetical protein
MWRYRYIVAIWYICWLFGIFSRFGMLKKEKSGNPGPYRNNCGYHTCDSYDQWCLQMWLRKTDHLMKKFKKTCTYVHTQALPRLHRVWRRWCTLTLVNVCISVLYFVLIRNLYSSWTVYGVVLIIWQYPLCEIGFDQGLHKWHKNDS